MSTNTDTNKYDKTKRVIAMICVILIGIMVFATLLSAFLDQSEGRVYFRSCLIVTIALPIAVWVFMWAYGAMTHKHTPASFDLAPGLGDETGEYTKENNGSGDKSDNA